MAKDGTNRGGRRPGSGRKAKPLAEKMMDGNTGHRKAKAMSFHDIPDLEAADMPEPHEMLSAEQRDGSVLQARDIYEKTWLWIEARGCTALVSPQLLERYAMSAARWIQCEEAVTRYGALGKHPTTGAPIASPYVTMSQGYMNQTNRLWSEIFDIVRVNSLQEVGGATPQNEVMERLLTARRG
ncbi:MAG: terminase [Synergistaceae bacterium]|nr:terminase [Synergistaceae bacterium]